MKKILAIVVIIAVVALAVFLYFIPSQPEIVVTPEAPKEDVMMEEKVEEEQLAEPEVKIEPEFDDNLDEAFLELDLVDK